MSTLPQQLITPDEYVALERQLETKHEYHNERMFAMAACTGASSIIQTNLTAGVWMVLVSQAEHAVDRFRRDPDGIWKMDPFRGPAAPITLSSVDIEIPLEEIYLDVSFDSAERD